MPEHLLGPLFQLFEAPAQCGSMSKCLEYQAVRDEMVVFDDLPLLVATVFSDHALAAEEDPCGRRGEIHDHVLGIETGATENAAAVKKLLVALRDRGLADRPAIPVRD
jgi:hypothetical protein